MLSNNLFIRKYFILAIVVAGCWQFSTGSYVYAKAHLAQFLLENAWSKTIKGQKYAKPWSWADTYPIAKISFSESNKEFIVLAGGSGRTMAFGPGHVSSTPLPGDGGNTVMVGHRDTHFSVLKELEIGDEIGIQTANNRIRYKVTNQFVVDQSQSEVMQDFGVELLTLITCYPFNTVQPGGPLRYVVQAESL